jgi:hypothetical protein
MFMEALTPTKDQSQSLRETISFDLLPTDDRDHLDLDTGEVFQDFAYARLHKKEKHLISASATFQAMPDDSYYKYNAMRYVGERNNEDGPDPSSIHFQVYLPAGTLRELAHNIRAGLYPNTIEFGLADDPGRFFTVPGSSERRTIEFGWEPDGSGKIWHNTEKENQRIAIDNVKFDYAVSKPQYDEGHDYRRLPMQFGSIVEQGSAQAALVQTGLADISKILRRIATGVIIVAALMAFLIVKQVMH